MITRFPAFAVFIALMILGNTFALYKMFTDKQEFLTKFPALSEKAFQIFRFLPLINLISLVGIGLLKSWGPWLAIVCALAVIAFDLYFSIYYHLYVALISTAILLFFIIWYWKAFK